MILSAVELVSGVLLRIDDEAALERGRVVQIVSRFRLEIGQLVAEPALVPLDLGELFLSDMGREVALPRVLGLE